MRSEIDELKDMIKRLTGNPSEQVKVQEVSRTFVTREDISKAIAPLLETTTQAAANEDAVLPTSDVNEDKEEGQRVGM